MDVISYRGPGAAGGVSSGLGNAWRQQNDTNTRWWFVADNSINVLKRGGEPDFIALLDESVIKGHYQYCNEFLWPVLHDLPEHASYSAEDRALYRRLNVQFSQHIGVNRHPSANQFVQDYQFALVPALMPDARCVVFWHVPWPKNVPAEFVEPMSEIARGLLSSHVVGFHTTEFVQNFMRFVQDNLPEYSVNAEKGLIDRVSHAPSLIEVAASQIDHPYVLRPFAQHGAAQAHATKLVAKPLGIDIERWQTAADSQDIADVAKKLPPGVLNAPLILSVDRADYTKAVYDRLCAVDAFFDKNPQYKGQVNFIQFCGRSRAGLRAFDQYWEKCRGMLSHINAKHAVGDWKAMNWIEESFSAEELAAVYRRANVMLVNPVRDGLNLTAKEFAACQHDDAGALLLSPGAGAWHEVGNYCLPANPKDHAQIVDSLEAAIEMPLVERRARNLLAKIKLERSSLARWWRYFHRATNAVGRAQDNGLEDRRIASA